MSNVILQTVAQELLRQSRKSSPPPKMGCLGVVLTIVGLTALMALLGYVFWITSHG